MKDCHYTSITFVFCNVDKNMKDSHTVQYGTTKYDILNMLRMNKYSSLSLLKYITFKGKLLYLVCYIYKKYIYFYKL